MARPLSMLLPILLAAGSLFAQDTACPQIRIDGPIGLGQPSEPQTYSVRIVPSENLPALSYLWSVTTHKGEVGMVRGQGTHSIYVPWSNDDVTVTVKVIGLPARCPENGSSSFIYDPQPVAEKLDEFVGPLTKVTANRFDNIVQIARRNPQAQLFILVSGKRGTAARSIKSKRQILTSQLMPKLHDYRVTFVESARSEDRVIVWLVPAGADAPRP